VLTEKKHTRHKNNNVIAIADSKMLVEIQLV